jgi:Protein of unknown function (DUF1566)
MKTNMRILWVGMFLMASATAHAQQLPQLPQFQANTPAKAADVNANFETLRGGVNSTEGRVTTLEGANAASRITTLEAQNAALTAQVAASVTCPANTPTRFTDNNDGTVCDSQTGLMWEIKEECGGAPNLANAHCRANTYTWSTMATSSPTLPTENQPDGTLYTDFLERLNDLQTANANDGTATPCFAGHCDWRIPTIGELRSIVEPPFPDCTLNPCIAAGFPGPTQASNYWSSSSLASNLADARDVNFGNGFVVPDSKDTPFHARAVRGGR